jgi:outer membrane protein assembly factor BamB
MTDRQILTVILIVGLTFSTSTFGADWPQWRGPFLNGSTIEKGLAASWSKTENIAWISPLPGPSAATPIVCNGRVFVSSAEGKGTKNVFALCLDAKTGKELWRKKFVTAERRIRRNNMATPSPVTDGKSIFFLYGSGDFVGLDYEGNTLWSRNIEKEYGNISIKFGYSSSPLLYDGKIYVLVQRRDKTYRKPKSDTPLNSFLLAVDPKTGKNLWKQPRQTDAEDESLDAYSTPIVLKGKKGMEIGIIGADYVTGYDPETGKELWRYGYSPTKKDNWRHVSSLVPGDGLHYGVKSRGSGLFVIRAGGQGMLSKEHIAWTFDGPTPDSSTPLLYEGNLYVLEGREKKIMTCLDAKTGRQKWQGKLGGSAPYYASATAADGKIYCINEEGRVVVVSAGNKQFKVISRIELESEPCRASIAIADGHLFIRTAEHLYCVGK